MNSNNTSSDTLKPFKKRLKLSVNTDNDTNSDATMQNTSDSVNQLGASTSHHHGCFNANLSPNSILSILNNTFGSDDTILREHSSRTVIETSSNDTVLSGRDQDAVETSTDTVAEEQNSELNLVIRDEDEQEILDLSKQIDCNLEQKAKEWNLSTINVKSILHHLIKNPQVLSLLGINMASLGSDDEETVQIRLTRRKARELMDTGKISWPFPMKEPVVASRTFLDVEYNNEDEDDDYDPAQEVEDPELEESEADEDSFTFSPIRPPTRRSASLSSTPILEHPSSPCGSAKSDDSAVPMKPPRTPMVLKKMKLPDIPCQHTRSKESLKTVPIEALEEKLQSVDPEYPQDISTECYANLDQDYMDFLSGLTFDEPAFTAPEEPPEEEDDPEWIFSEEKELDNDEVRSDRATKISKKEVEILLNDLFDIYNDNEDVNAEDPKATSSVLITAPSEETEQPSTSFAVAGPSQTDISQPQATSAPSINSLLSPGSDSGTQAKQWFLLTNALGPVLPIISVASTDPRNKCSFSSNLCQKQPIFTPSERIQLTHQLRKHVQLLMQTHLLTRTREDYKTEADSSIHMLLELDEQRKFKEKMGCRNTNFRILNLAPAIETAQRKVVEVPFKIFKGIMPRKEVKKKAVNPLPTRVMIELAASKGVLFPQLLPLADPVPRERLSLIKPAHPFMPSEDLLLVFGLNDFAGFPTPERWELIAKHLLPVRTPKEIVVRRRTSQKSPKDGPNPVRDWMESKILPEVPRDVSPLNTTLNVPFAWPPELQPTWLRKVVELASNVSGKPNVGSRSSPKRVFLQNCHLLPKSSPEKPRIGRGPVPIAPKLPHDAKTDHRDTRNLSHLNLQTLQKSPISASTVIRNCTNPTPLILLRTTSDAIPLSDTSFIPTQMQSSTPKDSIGRQQRRVSYSPNPKGCAGSIPESNRCFNYFPDSWNAPIDKSHKTPLKHPRKTSITRASPRFRTSPLFRTNRSPLKRAVDFLNERDYIQQASHSTKTTHGLNFLSPKRKLEAEFRAHQKASFHQRLGPGTNSTVAASTDYNLDKVNAHSINSNYNPEAHEFSNSSYSEIFACFEAPTNSISTAEKTSATVAPPETGANPFQKSISTHTHPPPPLKRPTPEAENLTSGSQTEEQKRKKRTKVQKTKDGITSLLEAPTSQQVVNSLCRAYFHDLQKALFMHESKLEQLMKKIVESENQDSVEELFPDLVGLLCSPPQPNTLLSRLLTLFLTNSQAEKLGCLKTKKNYSLAWITIAKIERYLASAKSKNFAKAVLRGMLEEGGNFGSDSTALKSYLKKTLSSEKFLLEEVMSLFPDEKITHSVPDECFETIDDVDLDEKIDYEFETISDLPEEFMKTFKAKEAADPDSCTLCAEKPNEDRMQCRCKLPKFKFSGGAVLMLEEGRYVAGNAVVSRIDAPGDEEGEEEEEEEVVVIDGRLLTENTDLTQFMGLVDDIEKNEGSKTKQTDIVREAICAAFGSSRISFSPDKTASNSSIFLRGEEGKDLMLSAANNPPQISPISSGVTVADSDPSHRIENSPPISAMRNISDTIRPKTPATVTDPQEEADWTAEEDRRLLLILQEKKLVDNALPDAIRQLPNRSSNQIRQRYELLVQLLDEIE